MAREEGGFEGGDFGMDFSFKFSIAVCCCFVDDGKGGNGRLLCWELAWLSVVYPPLSQLMQTSMV